MIDNTNIIKTSRTEKPDIQVMLNSGNRRGLQENFSVVFDQTQTHF